MAITANDIETLLAAEFDGASISSQGEGCSFQLRIVSDSFDGMNPVKRQQAVYRILNPHIASGDIHAVSMQLLTHTESAAASG